MQVWYDYSMYECDHKLVPIAYGYMYGDVIDSINNNEVIYGGTRKTAGSADWFCMNCLEDIHI
jgi:hypothetical protein